MEYEKFTYFVGDPLTKRRGTSCTCDHWGGQTGIYWHHHHRHIQSLQTKTAVKQLHIYPSRSFYHPRHQELLLQHSDVAVQIHAYTAQSHPRQNCGPIRPPSAFQRWLGIHGNTEWYARLEAGRQDCQQTPHQTPPKERIHTFPSHSRALASQHASHCIHLSGCDFGVKYTGMHNAGHLINALSALYTITVNQTGSLYYGLTLAWDYARGHVNISMPNYTKQALHKFKHPLDLKPEDAPHKWNQTKYGAKKQLAYAEDESPVLPSSEITHIQTVVGTLLYYAIAVDNTMLATLGDLACLTTSQPHPI